MGWVTSRILRAVPWLAEVVGRGGPRWEGGRGESAGFSITVPNWEKEGWVRSSMGMRRVGEGIWRGMVDVGLRGEVWTGVMKGSLRWWFDGAT